jgi:N-acetylglucosamine kinase-like BadF-type ATPase
MILIAESGSTKTHWLLVNGGKKNTEFTSRGLNPYVQKRELICEIIKEEVAPHLQELDIADIHFYGAGCSTDENKKIIYSCLKSFFHKSNIHVEHDLLAAARAGFTGETAIVAILGTGSNACIYDGKDTISVLPNLGYILGDEGSGAHMGKILIKDFLYRKMPFELSEKLRVEYNFDRDIILDHIYKLPSPNRWLASFSFFIREHIKEEYFVNLIRNYFREFFDIHISSLQSGSKKYPIHAIGSIAFHYQDYLKETAAEFGFEIGKIVKSPMDELAKYHKTHVSKV